MVDECLNEIQAKVEDIITSWNNVLTHKLG